MAQCAAICARASRTRRRWRSIGRVRPGNKATDAASSAQNPLSSDRHVDSIRHGTLALSNAGRNRPEQNYSAPSGRSHGAETRTWNPSTPDGAPESRFPQGSRTGVRPRGAERTRSNLITVVTAVASKLTAGVATADQVQEQRCSSRGWPWRVSTSLRLRRRPSSDTCSSTRSLYEDEDAPVRGGFFESVDILSCCSGQLQPPRHRGRGDHGWQPALQDPER